MDLLYELGAKPENIKIIFALGGNRDITEEEAEEKLGKRIATEITWENHSNSKNLVNLGKSTAGTPIFINKTFYDADFKIGVGCIKPHLWAGYSGGAKIVCPGLSGSETIAAHHRRVFDTKCRAGANYNTNPFRQDLEDIVSKAKLDMILNCTLNVDMEICQIVAGNPKACLSKRCRISSDYL